MKKFAGFAAVVLLGGCASQAKVSDLEEQLTAMELMRDAMDKDMAELVDRFERLEREMKGQHALYTSLRERVDKLAPPNVASKSDVDRIIEEIETQQPELRGQITDYLKQLETLAPDKAYEAALKIGKNVVPFLGQLLRKGEGKPCENARVVLQRWNAAEAAPLLSGLLADGTVREEVRKIFMAWPPDDTVRKELLKHADTGPDPWKVAMAEALVKARSKEGIKRLIQLLYHEDSSVRIVAINGLKDATRSDLGYKPYASKEDRRVAAEKWEMWWKENEATFAFPN